ncbi:PAS domain S-box protein [Belnapia sp. T18]|uniref:histidine kinase n=1 Tax=Belnapia arida TaxID=2804533 RepID=A0ABS1U8H5_9PROT|nr:PAS domain S-box protein [Belnapia arida]MBL6080820.1 PAS domain S-box protein [Belnapia arida]
MISPDIAQETRFSYPPFLVDNGVRAVANVPIIGSDGKPPFGILQVDSREPREFTENDTVFLRTYANLLAAAVNRLRTTGDLRDREARLRRSEERFRRVAEIETVGVIFFVTDGRITDGNAAFLRMSGFTRDDLESGLLRWDELTPPEWMSQTLRGIEQLKATGQGAPFEKEYFRKDGSRWWGLFAGRMLDDGTAVELVLDISDRKAAEGALRDSEARLRSLVEGIPQLVFRSRSSGERIWGSPQWIVYVGQSEEESVGLGWLNAVHPDDRAATMAAWTEAEARGRFSVEHRTYHAAGATWRWFQSRATPVRDAAGRILEWFGTSTDIDDQVRAREVLARGSEELEAQVAERTAELRKALESLRAEVEQREQAEANLRQMQKMEAVGQLTGGVAHDFNNLLTVIRSSAGLLRRSDLPEERRRRYVEAIAETADRAAKLTGQLLAFARRQPLKPEVFAVGERVGSVVELIRPLVGARISIEAAVECEYCAVEADPSQFETALVNLAVNARDAMEGEGQLTLRTWLVTGVPPTHGHAGTPGAFVAVSVSDTGLGISPELLGRIFEPFFTTKESGKGTGLGLSQVYGFAKQSGGELHVESEVGHGTTFTLYLPRVEAKPVVSPTQPKKEADAPVDGRRNVLLVEDNAQVGDFARQMLEDLGYVATWAPNAKAALELLGEDAGCFDVVFSDVVMPGMNGVELGQEIRRRWPDLPIVLTSGYSHVLANGGARGFELLHKPYSAEGLSRVLRSSR